MPNLITLLTTFTGRINRQQWWIGFIIVLIGSLTGTLLLDPQSLTTDNPPPNWPDTIWQLVWLIPGTAITVKCFNDRDWPWWLGYASALVSMLLYLPPHFGMPVGPGVGTVSAVVFWGVLAMLLLVFIDNGFIRGTDGPNRYGPDPLARSAEPT